MDNDTKESILDRFDLGIAEDGVPVLKFEGRSGVHLYSLNEMKGVLDLDNPEHVGMIATAFLIGFETCHDEITGLVDVVLDEEIAKATGESFH